MRSSLINFPPPPGEKTGQQKSLGKVSDHSHHDYDIYNLKPLQPAVFRLLGSTTLDGTFDTLLEDRLPDSRQQDPVPAVTFSFPESKVRFVKFEVLEHWGVGGGLQFIELLQTGDYAYTYHFMI